MGDIHGQGAADTPLQVRMLEQGDEARWDAFVQTCSDATFFHRAGWKEVLEQSFGHSTYFMYAETDGEIQGVLPLGHIHSRLFGNALISTPFCVYGGVAAGSEAVARVLEQAACDLARQLQVDYLELRQRVPRHPEWPSKGNFYYTFRKELDPNPERNMRDIPRKQRARVRKGIAAGLQCHIDREIDRFYEAYSRSVRSLGTPVFSKRYFSTLQRVFSDDCEILTVTHDRRVVAGVMNFYFRDEVLPYYGGGTEEARRFQANDFMYCEVMRRACERGVRVFDYGRSKIGTGAYAFKRHWGFEPQPLHYEYCLIKAKLLPELNPLNPKYRIFINAWKRLPLTVTRLLGPHIAKNLG